MYWKPRRGFLFESTLRSTLTSVHMLADFVYYSRKYQSEFRITLL